MKAWASSFMRSQLRAKLDKRGLTEGDLAEASEVSPELDRWKSAVERNDAAAASRAFEALQMEIDRLPLQPVLRRKMERIVAALEQSASRIPPERLRALDERYLALRSSISRANDRERQRAIAVEATALERELVRELR